MTTFAPFPSTTALLSRQGDASAKVAAPEGSRSSKGKARADGVRRLHVNAEAKPDLPGYLQHNELLRTVDIAVRQILDRSSPQQPSLPQIFSACELLVSLHGKGKDLADKIKLALERRCTEIAREYARQSYDTPQDAVDWVQHFVQDWQDFFDHRVAILSSTLAYFDRAYMLPNSLPSIRQQALDLARRHIFDKSYFAAGVKAGIVAWTNSERDAGKPDAQRKAFADLVAALETVNLYAEFFEQPYLAQTQKFFSGKSDEFYKYAEYRTAPGKFLSKWYEFRAAEEERMRSVLPRSPATVGVAEESFMRPRLGWACEAGVAAYMDSGGDGLADLHALCGRLEAHDVLRGAWFDYLCSKVTQIVTGDASAMVEALLDLRARALKVVEESFKERRGIFTHALDDAFSKGFGAGKTKPAEMIAKFLDAKMQSGQSGMADVEFSELLDRVLALFRYTSDKDVFRTFYTRALARRLLKARSASDDAEKKVIQKLREEHDPEFGKGDEMFKDLDLSRDLLEEFQRKASAPKGMSVMVLQQSAWPIAPRGAKEVDLPSEMLSALGKYGQYYKTKHSNRKLEWHHALGTATLSARFPGGNKELSVTLFQAVVLLLFNDSPRLSMAEIAERTHLDADELKRTLQSLALGKHRVIKKLSPGKDVKAEDEFEFNESFTDARTKLRLPSIQAPTETVEDDSRARAQIDGERQYTLDAAIVRLMKARRTMMHSDLVQEVVEAVAKHFKPQVDLLKKRIEKMIDEGYMERDEEHRNKYVYVA